MPPQHSLEESPHCKDQGLVVLLPFCHSRAVSLVSLPVKTSWSCLDNALPASCPLSRPMPLIAIRDVPSRRWTTRPANWLSRWACVQVRHNTSQPLRRTPIDSHPFAAGSLSAMTARSVAIAKDSFDLTAVIILLARGLSCAVTCPRYGRSACPSRSCTSASTCWIARRRACLRRHSVLPCDCKTIIRGRGVHQD